MPAPQSKRWGSKKPCESTKGVQHVHRFFRSLMVALLSLSLIACTTTRVISQGTEASAAALRQSPAVGDPKDSLIVVTKDGARTQLRVVSVDTESVTGTSLDHKQRFVIPLQQIERVEDIEIDTKSIVIVVLIVLVVLLAAGISTANSLAKPPNAVMP
jgi:hypothetical protein